MLNTLFRPGMILGEYPQKWENDLTDFEQSAATFFEKIQNQLSRKRFNQKQIVKKIQRYEEPLINCSEENLSIFIVELQEKLWRYGLTEELIAEAFAIIRETAGRTLNKRHYDVQLFGGWLMIQGMLAEMETGEGKTLTTTLPACTAALAGIPVHVITANDYLAARDAEIMAPLYQRLGLKGSAVVDGMDKEKRFQNYQCPIVHTTNKQIAFDYLRDRIEIGKNTGMLSFKTRQIQGEMMPGSNQPLLLKGLCFALIDEADSVLIDEANTPLIITQTRVSEDPPEIYSDALYLASSLVPLEDFTMDTSIRAIELTLQGEDKLAKISRTLPKHWSHKRKRELLVKQAIRARIFYKRNEHYIVSGGKVQIVDEFTGRTMADRSWEQGLHQMIEAKEGCLITEQRETIARISYQNFFKRYLRLGGTSGTLKEVAAELHSIYGLQTVKVPTHKPSKRILMQESIYRSIKGARLALLDRVAKLNAQNRPILIGTGSVAESEKVSIWLKQAGFPHRVLNANQDKDEAEIIAKAGREKAITVATNMAGRGTDISLGLGVEKLGGLHVIALNTNDSRRIDRQLYGRCARQGDQGSAEAILSLQDPALQQFYSSAMLKLFSKFCSRSKPMPGLFSELILRLPQYRKEKEQRKLRKQVMDYDRRLLRLMAFSGKGE